MALVTKSTKSIKSTTSPRPKTSEAAVKEDRSFNPLHCKLCHSQCSFYETNQELAQSHEPGPETIIVAEDFMNWLDRSLKGELHLILRGGDVGRAYGRRLSDLDMIFLTMALEFHTKITHVEVTYQEIADEGVITLTQALKTYCPDLKVVNLAYNNFGPEGMQELTEAIMQTHHLQRLVLAGNRLGNLGAKVLATQIASSHPSKIPIELDIGETDLGMEGFLYLTNVIRDTGCPKFITMNRILFKSDQEIMEAAVRLRLLLQYQPSLLGLGLQKCSLRDWDIEEIFRELHPESTLSLLDLTANCLHADGADTLAHLIVKQPTVRVLLLGHNNIGETGARCFTYNIPNSNLEVLDLSHNGITSEGLCFLSYAFRHSKITHLFMWGNHFDNKSGACYKQLFDREILKEEHSDFLVYEVDGVAMVALQPRSRSRHEYNHYFT